MPSRFTNFLSSAATGLNNYTQAKNIMNQQKITGGIGKTAKTATKTWVGNAPRSVHEKLGIGNGIYRR